MKNRISIITVVLLITLIYISAPNIGLCAEPVISCEELIKLDFGSDVKITSAETIPATDELPAHCSVAGYRWPDDGFIIKLPLKWNERLLQTGNGGAAGMIIEQFINTGLKKGYVAVSGSGGHRSPEKGFQFGYPPDDLVTQEKIDDYCFGSVHETNILARKMIKAFYGADPVYAYYNAFSTGARQGFMEAQRFTDDFNGILVGSPPFPFTMRTMADNWVSTMLLGDSYIPISKLSILAQAVMDKCDSKDGLKDGLITNPPGCDFNALNDLPPCPEDADGPDCFTKAQREAVYKIYDGIRDSDGDLLFKGVSLGSEGIMGDGKSGWYMMVPETPGGYSISLRLGGGYVQWIGLPPNGGGPSWDWKNFNIGEHWDSIRNKWSNKCDTYDPNLTMFRLKGGKLIHYHGWSDPLCWAQPSVDYYERSVDVTGSLKDTQDFYRLYMIPGMAHFSGYGVFDRKSINEPMFKALVEWVENGIAPDKIVGSRNSGERLKVLSRPVCPYPAVSRYLGTGSSDSADNFTCVTIVPAKVRIEPKTISMDEKGDITAFVTCPEGYNVKGWDAFVCQGALARMAEIIKNGQTYKAKFSIKDILNLKPGASVSLTVTAVFEKDGERFALEGNDYVKILK